MVKYWHLLSSCTFREIINRYRLALNFRKLCLEEVYRCSLAVNFWVFRLEIAVTCRCFLAEVYARLAAVLSVFQIGARCRVDAVLVAVAIDFVFTPRIQIGFSNVEIVSPGTNYEEKNQLLSSSKTLKTIFNIKILLNIKL